MPTWEKLIENNNELEGPFKEIRLKLEKFFKEVKEQWWWLSWFFKALSNLNKEKENVLTEEDKKTQENLNKIGAQLIDANFSDLEDSIYGIKIERSLEQDLQNEETILWVLSKNKVVKEWFDWFTSWIDDWLNINGRTGKEIKADWVEFVLLAAKKFSDDDGKEGVDLTLDDLETLWKSLWKIKKICEDAQLTYGKTKEQVLSVCAQKLKDKLKISGYDITKVDITKEELEGELKKLDDNPDNWWQPSDIENPNNSEDE